MDPLIWVFVAEKHHRFDPSKSFTFQNLSKPLFVQYGTGGVQGFLGYDTVTVSEVAAAWTHPTFPCSYLSPETPRFQWVVHLVGLRIPWVLSAGWLNGCALATLTDSHCVMFPSFLHCLLFLFSELHSSASPSSWCSFPHPGQIWPGSLSLLHECSVYGHASSNSLPCGLFNPRPLLHVRMSLSQQGLSPSCKVTHCL